MSPVPGAPFRSRSASRLLPSPELVGQRRSVGRRAAKNQRRGGARHPAASPTPATARHGRQHHTCLSRYPGSTPASHRRDDTIDPSSISRNALAIRRQSWPHGTGARKRRTSDIDSSGGRRGISSVDSAHATRRIFPPRLGRRGTRGSALPPCEPRPRGRDHRLAPG